MRFQTPPGEQAQVDFARFEVEFTDEPGVKRIVWLFSMVLGYSRLIWARFVLHQDMQSVLCCHIAAFDAIGGAPRTILYDRMKTAVIGEDADGLVIYNRALVDIARHYGFQPRACRSYQTKTKGKVERPFRYIREDFFLGGAFRNLDDLNEQLRHWLDTVANPRVHATTNKVVNEAFAEERSLLKAVPTVPYRAVLRLERRASHEGMVSVGGNLYSVPDTTRRRVFEVHVLADEVRIFEDGARRHPRSSGGTGRETARSFAPQTRQPLPPPPERRAPDPHSRWRSCSSSLARLLRRRRPPSRTRRRRSMSASSVIGRVKTTLVALKMPRALEVLDVTLRGIEPGEIGAVEAIDALLTEELTMRENPRVRMAVQMARLSAIKPLAGFDFAFQPSLDRNRILALAGLQFADSDEAARL